MRGINLIGQRFGRLQVIELLPKDQRPEKTAKRGNHWICQCDCGNKVIHYTGALQQGDINSCGCLSYKTKMKEAVNYRSFTITLVKVKSDEAMAIGGYCPDRFDTFVPKLVSPLDYRQIFINELIKLGFAEEDMELYIQETDLCDYYNIKLTW